jgi:hypothetical protein
MLAPSPPVSVQPGKPNPVVKIGPLTSGYSSTDRPQAQTDSASYQPLSRDRYYPRLAGLNCKTEAFFLACYSIRSRRIETLRTGHNFHKQRGRLTTKIDLVPPN